MERNDLSLGERLAGLRKTRGLSQDQLAELLDVSRQTVSRWEVGEAAPTAENRKKLSQLYAIPLESLTDTPGWTPPPAGDPEPLPEEMPSQPRQRKNGWKAAALCILAALAVTLAALAYVVIMGRHGAVNRTVSEEQVEETAATPDGQFTIEPLE